MDEENKKQRKKEILLGSAAIGIVALAGIIFLVVLAWKLFYSDPLDGLEAVPPETKSWVELNPEPTPEPIPEPTPAPMLPEMQELYDQNSDVVGYIKIEGTKIDYPVMYTPEDGQFYLYRNFEKKSDPTMKGCIFVDKNCTVEPRSTNILLHGHNMNSGAMFNNLINYKRESYYKEHPIIEYNTLYEKQQYEIIAVFLSKVYKKTETDVFKYYQFYNAENEEEFNYYINNCKALALYDTGVEAKFGDELLTLSTCEYSTQNGRIVVVARKIS